MIPYLFDKFQRSNWEGLWNPAEIEITLRCENFSNSANMDKPCCYVWKVAYPLVSAILVILNVLSHITKLYKRG